MVFPIGDDNHPNARFPFITYLLIGANVVLFIMQLQGGDTFTKEWAFIPSEFFARPMAEAKTIMSSMFLHGGWMHLIGNMVYLWTFGDNVEDDFGHFGFLLFYIVAGVAATFAQALFISGSTVPHVGASGAIAGVLGSYILLHPQGKVRLLTQAGIVYVPAILAIGFWIGLQFFSFAGEFATPTATSGGVAYMAHIGGFVAGFVLTFLFRSRMARA